MHITCEYKQTDYIQYGNVEWKTSLNPADGIVSKRQADYLDETRCPKRDRNSLEAN